MLDSSDANELEVYLLEGKDNLMSTKLHPSKSAEILYTTTDEKKKSAREEYAELLKNNTHLTSDSSEVSLIF